MLSVAIVMSDWKESTTFCPKLDVVRLTSDTPKTKKKGTSATQIIFHLKMVQESLVPIKTDSDLAKKNSKKNTNKFNFEKTGFWCPKLHVLTVGNKFL